MKERRGEWPVFRVNKRAMGVGGGRGRRGGASLISRATGRAKFAREI